MGKNTHTHTHARTHTHTPALWPGPVISSVLGGSWVVISGVISPLIWVLNIDTLLLPHL